MESINRLKIDNKHIYQEHFDRADMENVALFYHNIHTYKYNLYLCVKSKIAVIQPLTGDTNWTTLPMVFDTFKAKLRAGSLKGYVEHRSKQSRGFRRSRRSRGLNYYCLLDFFVGTFPVRRRGRVIKRHETCYVKVVCATSKCRNHFCRRLAPKLVIIMFPYGGCN